MHVAGGGGNRSLGEILGLCFRAEPRDGKLAGLGAYRGGHDVAGHLKGLVFQIFMDPAHDCPPERLRKVAFPVSAGQLGVVVIAGPGGAGIVRSISREPDVVVV